MSFQNKGFWMAKVGEHFTDGGTAFDNPSRIEPKRSHQWLVDATEPELFPNKKQTVQALDTKSSSGILNASVPPWENVSSFQSVPNPFIDRLFGSEMVKPVNFSERNISPVGTDNSNLRRKGFDEQFGNGSSANLSISHTLEDPENCLSYGGIRKVKVNQVKESDNGMHAPEGHGYSREIDNGTSTVQVFDRGNEGCFISMGQSYGKEDGSVTLMGHTYSRVETQIQSIGGDNTLSVGHPYKEDTNTISFGGFHDESEITIVRPVNSYNLLYNQASVHMPETASEKELDTAKTATVVSAVQGAKLKPDSVSKSKQEFKISKKEAPNSFPSNVRSLISTGMLDGVPVKYVSLSRQELRGIIKGSGYLCGCPSCNFSKVLNAYEFERHAGCKTKHPNNHIYFENGKTIYQIVQELRSTPESKLFHAIQTVFGAPINQKSFRIWKESFQAATRELQRIYGKEELNL